jgi:hypothetical protein
LSQQAKFESECPSTGESVSVHGPSTPGAVRMMGRKELRAPPLQLASHLTRPPTALIS